MSKFRDLLKVGLALALCFGFAGVVNAEYTPTVTDCKSILSTDTELYQGHIKALNTMEQDWDKKLISFKTIDDIAPLQN